MQARRLSAVVLTATMAVGLAACGKDDKPITTATGGQTASTPATTPSTLAAPTTTAAPKTTVATATTGLGTVFVDATGKTLYTWDKDTSTTSACTGGCAATWPALLLPAGATTPVAGAGITNLTAVARPDDAAKMQVVWNDKPLYLYAADTAPGDTKGDGVGGTWHVAKPA